MANPINTERKYRTVAVKATPFIIIGGICIGFGWKFIDRRWNRKEKYHLPRSMALAALHGGKPAMERLVDYHNHRGKGATDKTDGDIKELENLLGKEPPPIKEIQRALARLEISRREDEAIKMLKQAVKKARKAKSHEAYEIEMLLAEMYIYKGDVQKALKCKCLTKHQEVPDARRPLYMAVISLMDQKEQDALKYWESFKEIQIETMPPSSDDEEFMEFKKAVNTLKHDVDAPKKQ